jgi:hypothetical protein
VPIARAVQGGTHAENRGPSWWSILYGVGGAVVVDLLTYGIDPTVRNQNLERFVASDPAVAMVAVGSVADDVKGELARAYVALRPGMTATEDDIVNHCRAHLAAYKLPRSVRFASDLPKTSTGRSCGESSGDSTASNAENSTPVASASPGPLEEG